MESVRVCLGEEGGGGSARGWCASPAWCLGGTCRGRDGCTRWSRWTPRALARERVWSGVTAHAERRNTQLTRIVPALLHPQVHAPPAAQLLLQAAQAGLEQVGLALAFAVACQLQCIRARVHRTPEPFHRPLLRVHKQQPPPFLHTTIISSEHHLPPSPTPDSPPCIPHAQPSQAPHLPARPHRALCQPRPAPGDRLLAPLLLERLHHVAGGDAARVGRCPRIGRRSGARG